MRSFPLSLSDTPKGGTARQLSSVAVLAVPPSRGHVPLCIKSYLLKYTT